MADNKKFLDYSGLQILWGLIENKFADKTTSLDYNSLQISGDSGKVQITKSSVDGTQEEVLTIPVVSETAAGILTGEMYQEINERITSTDGSITFKGLGIVNEDGNNVELTLDTNKIGSLKLAYESTSDNEAYIKLVDGNNEDVYSKIDVSALIKTGLLAQNGASLETTEKGTVLRLVFLTSGDDTRTVDIPVGDLIDVYTNGDGIEITGDASSDNLDGAISIKTITLKTASDNEIGGIKTGYAGTDEKTYAVKVDENGNAYVNVPWLDVESGSTSIEVTTEGAFKIGLTDTAENAISTAATALQSVNVLGKELSISDSSISVDEAKTYLGLKDAAYKEVDTELADNSVNLPTSTAVKTYVDSKIDEINGDNGYKAYVDGKISDALETLDATITAGTDANGKKQFITAIAQTDGKLDASNSVLSTISVDDLVDFSALTEDEIKLACGITE